MNSHSAPQANGRSLGAKTGLITLALALETAAFAANAPVLAQSLGEAPVVEELAVHDLEGLRGAVDLARHAVHSENGVFLSRNSGLGWTTRYGNDGALTGPAGGDWSWGLSLESWGYTGSASRVDDPCAVAAEGNRVTLEWEDQLSEWWINDHRGIEHGFTLQAPPSGEGCLPGATLEFVLDVRGTLTPEVHSDGRGARFVNAEGAAAMTYSGLVAFDATGRTLPAWMETNSTGKQCQLTIRVAEEGALYPITVDPISQNAYLKASNAEANDYFGTALAISGNTVVVGAYFEESNATGIDGDQSNNDLDQAGAAYVFVRSGGTWTQQAYLKASNTGFRDYFAVSLDVSGDTIAVGAFGEDGASSGLNGDETTNSKMDSGAVYIFTRSGTTWTQTAYIKGPNSDTGDQFGVAVALDGNRLVVGANADDSASSGVNGDQANNGLLNSGAAHVYSRSGSTWTHDAFLKASNPDIRDSFGGTVDVSGDTLVVGAQREWSAARGVNGDQSDNSLQYEGAAYAFFYDGTSWVQQAYLKSTLPVPTTGNFAGTLAVSGDVIVIGASAETEGMISTGSAYVYERTGTTWTAVTRLTASNGDHEDYFGTSVDVVGDTIAVGAFGEASALTTIDGDGSNNLAQFAGACYVFTKVGSRWLQQSYLKAANAEASDALGNTIALSADMVIAGATSEASASTGVNGDPSNNSAPGAGAVMVFDLVAPGTTGTNFCNPLVLNSSMMYARITATGSPIASANNLTLTVTGLPTAGTTALLVTAKNPTATVSNPMVGGIASNGRLCIASARMGRDTGSLYMGNAGTFSRTLDLTRVPFPASPGVGVASVLSGDTWYWQCWYRDGVGGGSNFSNAIRITFQ